MKRDEHPEDLLVLARQCKLEQEEERRFQMSVQSSRELEALYHAGVEFDEQASLLPGDETRLHLLVERTLARLDQGEGAPASRPSQRQLAAVGRARAPRAARSMAASLGLGVLLAVALASAWEYVKQRESPQRPEPAAASVIAHTKPSPQPEIVSPPVATVASPPSATAAITDIPVIPQQPRPTPSSHESKNHANEAAGASELFARANEFRRQGDVEAAISAYERLGKQYPSSVEAEDAKVLMGNLLLSQRSPRAALQRFDDYGSGALSLEASWGRAQALRMLGSPEERAALEQLVRDYPNSPYAGAAQKRLRELPP